MKRIGRNQLLEGFDMKRECQSESILVIIGYEGIVVMSVDDA